MTNTDQNRRHKYIIIGAGPGGLQMGYFLGKQQRDYLILEREQTPCSAFLENPRHRKLISINKKYNYFTEDEFNMRHDWNSLVSDDPELRMTRYSDELWPHADTFVKYCTDFAERFALNIAYGVTVENIHKEADGTFTLKTSKGEYRCEVLMLALGAVLPKVPDIPGIEHTLGYENMPVDLEFYKNKRVAVMGQGNSAFETADHLAPSAAYVHVLTKTPVRFAWDTHFVGDLRAINNNTFDLYQLKAMHAVLNPRVKRIDKLPDGTLQTSHDYDFPSSKVPGTLELTREYDIIIRAAGWKWVNPALFDETTMPSTWADGKFPALTTSWESVNVKNMFFVGGAMQGNDRQAATGFIHGYRYTIRTLHYLLEERFEGVPYPSQASEGLDWDKILDDMYKRFSVSAALFQLFGVLCDVLVVSKDLKHASYYKEMPKTFVDEKDFGDNHVLVFTLEFGFEKFHGSPVTFLGPSDPNDTSCAAFLHPVIRYKRNGATPHEFHFGDSLLVRWDRPHGKGGAVMSYHYHFQKWLEDRLGLDFHLPPASPSPGYRVWSKAELEQYAAEKKKMMMEHGSNECANPFKLPTPHLG